MFVALGDPYWIQKHVNEPEKGRRQPEHASGCVTILALLAYC